MKTIRHSATLYYYDGPQVFEARDSIGGHYVAVMVASVNGRDRFLVAGVSPERLRQFRTGLLDLKVLLTDERDDAWYITTVEHGLDQTLDLDEQYTPLTESGLLPEPGFVLHDRPAEEETLKEARERNNLVLEVSVDPPEAANDHRIRVSTLAGLLEHMQTVVKHAYGAALREMPLANRREIDRMNAHLLDVVIPAKAGSFRVLLEAAQTANLLGHSELTRALERMDALFEHTSSPRLVAAKVKENRGHLAGAYLRLLRFLLENKTGLSYSWAEPSFARSSSRAITQAEAGPLVETLDGVSNLGAEPVNLKGRLEKADLVGGTWRILTDEGTYSGKIKEGGPSLVGIKLGAEYHFSCMEEIEEVGGTGREQRTLYLIEHEPI